MVKVCLYCGGEFKLESSHQRYCLDCKKDAYRKKYREQSQKYRKEHPEYLEWKKAWSIKYSARRDVKRKRNEWAKAHYEQATNWRKQNPEKVKKAYHRSNAIKRGYEEEFSYEIKQKVKIRDRFECQICGEHEKSLVIHHKDKTKTNNRISNLITLCRACHMKIHGPP